MTLRCVFIFLAILAGLAGTGYVADSRPTCSKEKFAVLISGTTDPRFRKNLGNVYKLLLKNGYQQENIYILDWKGEKSDRYPVTGPAHWQSIESIFFKVAERVAEAKNNNRKTDFFLYVTGHGIREVRSLPVGGGKYAAGYFSEITLAYRQYVDEVNFAYDVNLIHFDRGIFVFAQCYGGGFAQRLSGKNRIAIAASAPDEMSWDLPPQTSFTDDFVKALENPETDLNGDGKVDIQEAFHRASVQSIDKKPKDTPLILVGDEIEDLDL